MLANYIVGGILLIAGIRLIFAGKGQQMDDERVCPECHGPEEDIVIGLDEWADCYACNWQGHEDDLMEVSSL